MILINPGVRIVIGIYLCYHLLMRSKAFTFLEVMLVLIILVAVFFPLLQMFSSGLLASSEVKDTNTAVILAQKKMEEIRNSAFSSISSEPTTVISSYPAYSRQVIVSRPETTLKDVQVIIYWSTGKELASSVSIETLIFDL